MRPSEERAFRKQRAREIKEHGQLGPCLSCSLVAPRLPIFEAGWHIQPGGHLCGRCYLRLCALPIGGGVWLDQQGGWKLVRLS